MKKIILLIFVLFGFVTLAQSKTVTVETVESKEYFSHSPKSALVDESGVVHSAYGGDHVYYGTLNTESGEGWTVQTIDAASNLSVYGLDRDESDISHILAVDISTDTWYYIYGNPDTGGWTKEEIEALSGSSDTYQYITIQVNKITGVPSIICRNESHDLMHLTYLSGAWDSEVVNPDGFAGDISVSDFKIDADGYLHVICGNDSKKEIYYLTNLTGFWTSETIVAGDQVMYISLILGSDSKIRAAYSGYHADSRSYVFCSLENTSGIWVREEIDSSPSSTNYFKDVVVNIDESGATHIVYEELERSGASYFYYLNHAIKTETEDGALITGEVIGTFSGISILGFGFADDTAQIIFSESYTSYRAYGSFGSWEIETVDSVTGLGVYSSTDIDSSNFVHIAHQDYISGDLLYSTNETGVWNTEIIDSVDDVGSFPFIKTDSFGLVHICYYDSTNKDLKYAVRDIDKTWSVETVDSDGSVGEHCSLDVDHDGVVHISYKDSSNNAIKYAFGEKGSWTIEKIYTADSMYSHYVNKSSVIIDKDQKAHIVFFDYKIYTPRTGSRYYSFDLIHAKKEESSWGFETLDSFNADYSSSYSNLHIDNEGFFHIFYGVGDSFLNYTTNRSGSWVTDTIDSGDGVYVIYADSDIDSNGYGHVLYASKSFGHLKYAHGYSGVWDKEDFEEEDAGDQSLAIGTDGIVHFIYKQGLYSLYHGIITYCDGVVDEVTECDDGNRVDGDGCSALCEVETPYYLDADGDSFVSDSSKYFFTKPISGYADSGGDCNDTDSTIHPGVSETTCDGVDNNCDEVIDEDFVSEETSCGVGACTSTGSTSCSGGVVNDSCISLEAGTEICENGLDDDCDGSTDEIEDCPVTGSSTSSDSTTGDPTTTGEGSGSTSSTGEETTGGDSSSTGEGSGSAENGTTDGTTGGGTTENGTTGEEGSSSSSTSSDGSSESTGSDTSSSSDGSSTTSGGATDEGNPNPTPPPSGDAADGSGGCSLNQVNF